MHTFMQGVVPDTHLHVGDKLCLDLMALSKKLLGEYSKRWVLLPGTTENDSNKQHLKSPWGWFTPQTPKLPAVDNTSYGWAGMFESHPAGLFSTDSRGSFSPGQGSSIAVHSGGGHQSCFPIWFVLNVFVRALK